MVFNIQKWRRDDILQPEIEKGNAWRANQRVEILAGGSPVYLLAETPGDTTRVVFRERTHIYNGTEAIIGVFEDADATNSGTPNFSNMNRNFTTKTPGLFFQTEGVTVTDEGTKIDETLLPEGERALPVSFSLISQVILKPSTQYLLKVENNSADTDLTVEFQVVWFELDIPSG